MTGWRGRIARLAFGVAVASPWICPLNAEAQDHDLVVLENEHVLVTERFAGPGSAGRDFQRAPGVLISLGKSRVEVTSADDQVAVLDFDEGQVMWREPAGMAGWKVVAGDAHFILVEIRSAATNAAPAPVPLEVDHSTIVDPDQHHLVFENEHVRIIDGFAPAGAVSERHTHPPSVLVSLAKSRFRVTIADRTRIFDFEPAMVRWSNHFEHRWRILAGDARVIMIEVKSAHADPAFQRRP